MKKKPQLKRSLKLTAVTVYGVGSILGAGIYVLIGEVAAAAGYAAPLSFLVAALIALFSAFSYAELGARFPKSAGEAVYIDEAFARRSLTKLVGLMVVATGIVSAATMATGVVGYAQIFFPLSSAVIITFFLLLVGLVALWGIEQSAWVVAVITLLEVAGLIYVVFVARNSILGFPITAMFTGPTAGSGFDGSVVAGLLLGSFLAFYAYIGFEDMVNIAEEIQQPEKVLPVAIVAALVIATLFYFVVAVAALSVLTPQQLSSSAAPLADVVQRSGNSVVWISAISLVAVINGAIVQIIMASRVIYGLATRGLLAPVWAEINRRTSTPLLATLLCTAITLLLALVFPLGRLAELTSTIVLCVFALVNFALIRLNKARSGTSIAVKSAALQTVHFPSWIPYTGLILCFSMLLIKVVLWLSG